MKLLAFIVLVNCLYFTYSAPYGSDTESFPCPTSSYQRMNNVIICYSSGGSKDISQTSEDGTITITDNNTNRTWKIKDDNERHTIYI
jgi:WD40 repeat protein